MRYGQANHQVILTHPLTTAMSKQQIDDLNRYQQRGDFHPYTCDRKSPDCEVHQIPRDYSKDGVLIATEAGWVCPCGNYTQPLPKPH